MKDKRIIKNGALFFKKKNQHCEIRIRVDGIFYYHLNSIVPQRKKGYLKTKKNTIFNKFNLQLTLINTLL